MKHIVNITATVIALISGAEAAKAQAFGIQMGTPLESLEVVSDDGDGSYTINVPKPHSEFEGYRVTLTPETGVCRVSGVGKDHRDDRFGDSVKRSFSNLRDRLTENYGKHYLGDFLRDGALWDGENEWVMAINQNERTYQAVWDAEEKSKLTSDLSEIMLNVGTLSSDTSFLFLRYTFSNYDKCKEIISEAESGGL